MASGDESVTRKHTEVQARLALLGKQVGCDVWIPRSDQGTAYGGKRLGDFSLKNFPSLPLPTDALRTIQNIDVVWIRNGTIEAAFEVESTTSIYSGLLRMSDLITSLPNVNISLFIMTDRSRREDVFRQVNRPTFEELDLPNRVRYLSFEALEGDFSNLLKYAESPRVLGKLAEDIATAARPPEEVSKKQPGPKVTWEEKLEWAVPQVRRELLPRVLAGIRKEVTPTMSTRNVGRWLYVEDERTFCVFWVKKRGFMVSVASDATFKDPRDLSHEVKGFFFPRDHERRFSLELEDDLDYALALINEGHRVAKSARYPWKGSRRPTRSPG